MFTLIESKNEIAKVQRQLEATIRSSFMKTAVKNIGYPGGTQYNAKVHTDGSHWSWSADLKDADTPNPRRLNWFGLFNEDGDLQISVEINTAHEGRNDQVAGFFAHESDTGSIYLFHSGRVGGGTKGVGKFTFLSWSNLRLVDVVDSSGGVRQGVLVMPIAGRGAVRSAVRYVDTIARFKQAVRAGDTNTKEFRRKKKEFDDFYTEPRGRRKGRRSSEIDYLSRHGDVVDALQQWRISTGLPQGSRVVKSVHIDLGVAMDQKLFEVFEVKTATGRSGIYGAIGQLVVHGAAADCQRAIVLPHKDPIAADLTEALKRLGIKIIRFKLDEHKATIV